MKKLPLSEITAAVALSYLVLIPVTAYYVWQRIKVMDHDIVTLCDTVGVKTTELNVTPIDKAKSWTKGFLKTSR